LGAITIGVGTAMLMDFRLLGLALPQKSAAELWRDGMFWTLCGLVLAIFSGLMLFSIDPEAYFVNPAFRFKMGALILAIVFHYTAVRRMALSSTSKPASFAVGGISLGLWTLVPSGGIFIGFA
jgi:hypothetical protein